VEDIISKSIKMSEFKQYKRFAIAEIREVTEREIREGLTSSVSLSEADKKAGSPKPGDMVGRNPKNHEDQWLIAAQYFKDNFEEF